MAAGPRPGSGVVTQFPGGVPYLPAAPARPGPRTTIAMQAIAAEAVLAAPGPDGPDMFRCAAPQQATADQRASFETFVAQRGLNARSVQLARG
jgi:hypothetical protein